MDAMPRRKQLFIDNNVWDLLFERQLDLETELPRERFSLHVTKEASFEIRALAHRPDKAGLLAFIIAQCSAANVLTDCFFGFADPNLAAEDQRVGGFDEGRWISAEESAFLDKLVPVIGRLRRTGLYKDEADLSLAARAMVATVLTFDARGPLRSAYQDGGDVIFLRAFDTSGLSLADFIMLNSRRP